MIRIIGKVCLYALPILLIAVVLAEFTLTNYLAGKGREVGVIDRQIAALREENERLTQQIASASSLLNVSDRARALGFMEPTRYMTIGPEQFTVALSH